MRCFKHAVAVADIRARRHAEPADLRGAGIGQIIAIQIRRCEHAVFIRAHEHLLEHRICDAIVDHQLLLPLALSMSRVNRVQCLLHFVVNGFLERIDRLLQSRLDHRGILFNA